MPASKLPPSTPPGLEEPEQRVHLVRPGRAPERAAGDRRQDLGRARGLVGGVGRPAGEDRAPARRIARHRLRGPERAADLHRADRRVAHVDLVVGQHAPALERLGQPLRFPLLPHERDTHDVRTRFDRDEHLQVRVARHLHELFPLDRAGEARLAVPRVARRGGPARGVAADGKALHQSAVEADVERLRPPHPHQVVLVLPPQPHPDQVVAVDGEGVGNRHATARAEREVLALPSILHDVDRHLERVHPRCRRRQAGREARDVTGHRQVALEVRPRDGQDVGEVVEAAVGRLVAGQERLDVDVQREEIADGVVVLGAVEPMHGVDAARIGIGQPRGVEPGLEQGGHGPVGRRVGPRAAGGRHRFRAQLLDDALPELRVVGRARGIRRVEGEARRAQPLVVAADAVAVEDRPRVDGPA